MGIRGLYSFVDSYDDFFVDVKLCNEKIIIDGSNLRYVLYNKCTTINSAYGGDYKKYYDCVSAFANKLLQCGVVPLVVVDGAHDPSGLKMNTVIKRAKDQVRGAMAAGDPNFKRGQCKSGTIPVFGQEVFHQALRDANVSLVQSNFEADRYMAALGRAEGCPVASNDSDFFVYDVEFVPLDSLVFGEVEEGDDGAKQITCRRFDKSRFLREFGLSSCDHLYLMSSVLGNDYIPIHSFEKFFAQVRKPKKKNLSPRRKQMIGFLGYLSKEQDISAAIDKILSHVPVPERKRLRTLIDNSIAVYQCGNESTDDAVGSELRAFNGAPLPSWMVEEFRRCTLPNWLLDALCNGVFVLQSQVEDRAAPSSHLFARPFIEETLRISLGTCSGAEFPTTTPIKLFTREGGTSKAVKIEIQPNVDDDLPHLRDWSLESRRGILLEAADMSPTSLPDGLENFCISMRFWMRKADQPVSLVVWRALALSWLILLGQGGKICDIVAFQEIARRINTLNPECREKFQERCRRFLKTNTSMKRCTMAVVYSLANLQAVVYHASVLSRLVHTQWLEFRADDIWNGTLIFNIHHDLEGYSDLDNRCEAILHFDEVLVSCFRDLLEIFRPFVTAKLPSKKERRKKGKNGSELLLKEVGNKFELLSVSDADEQILWAPP